MIQLDQYQKLKRIVEQLQREADQAGGAYKQLMEQAREEFGCKTLEDVEQEVQKWVDKELAAAEKVGRLMKKVETEWPELWRRLNG